MITTPDEPRTGRGRIPEGIEMNAIRLQASAPYVKAEVPLPWDVLYEFARMIACGRTHSKFRSF